MNRIFKKVEILYKIIFVVVPKLDVCDYIASVLKDNKDVVMSAFVWIV